MRIHQSLRGQFSRVDNSMRDQEFTDDERETIRRGIAKVRGAADWLEAAIDTGQFTFGRAARPAPQGRVR
ncbi:DUF6192 family protein [Streptomyces chartreusis]|uniref:DUF6192 family protein n=1 Tax=Streptomyces chartreusis TaxID=1969 RepID=UPI0038006C7F